MAKFGIDVPGHQAAGRPAVSQSEFRRSATNVPSATPRGTAMRSAAPARSGLTRSPGAITSITGVLA